MSHSATISLRKMRSTDFIKTAGIRLWNPTTRAYLHMSGEGETKDVNYSWRGFVRQAQELRCRAEIRGEEWPYHMQVVKE